MKSYVNILNFFWQHLLEFNERPDLSHEDREKLIEDLVLGFSQAFPFFSFWNF